MELGNGNRAMVMEKSNVLATGPDSVVLIGKDDNGIPFITKKYIGPRFALIGSDEKDLLEEYSLDTKKAEERIRKDQNPLGQFIEINGVNCFFEYRIIPQGTLKTEHEDGKEINTLYGQEFINGLNLSAFLTENHNPINHGFVDKNKAAEGQDKFTGRHDIYVHIENEVKDFFIYLSGELHKHLSYSSKNVKPFIDVDNTKIKIVITDLCADLKSYYDSNTKFKKQRQ